MFKNAFANLQKVGKSLMLPVSVLPIAGILLGVGSANFSWLPAVVSHVMAEAGGSVFANMPLIFAIGVALGFTNNMAYPRWPQLLPMASWLKPWPWLRHWYCIYLLNKSPLNSWRILAYSEGLSPVRSQRTCLTVSTVLSCLSILASLPVNALCRSFLAWLPSLLALCCPSFGRRLVLQSRPSLSGLLTRTR